MFGSTQERGLHVFFQERGLPFRAGCVRPAVLGWLRCLWRTGREPVSATEYLLFFSGTMSITDLVFFRALEEPSREGGKGRLEENTRKILNFF